MTVLSTSYSTLEEAWGTTAVGGSRKGSSKKAKSAPKDPLCDLYSRRLAKVRKPYTGGRAGDDLLEDAYTYDDQFYAPYARAASGAGKKVPRAAGGESALKAPALPPMILDGTGDIDAEALPDDDDVFFERALDKRLIHESDEWQDAASVAGSEVSAPSSSKAATVTASSEQKKDSAQAPVVATVPVAAAPRRSSRDRLMDFGLYVASGILLLFLLEQIFQMGMRMKLPAAVAAAAPPAF